MAGLVMFEIVTKVGTLVPGSPEKEPAFIEGCLRTLGYPTWAYIVHDMDIKDNGEKKDPHYHIIARRSGSNGKYLNVIAKEFGISPNFIEKIKGNFYGAILYLTHKNASDKFQYPDSAVHSSFDYTAEVNSAKLKNEKRISAKSLERRAIEFAESVLKGENIWADVPDVFTVEEYLKIKKMLKDAEQYDKMKRAKDNAQNDFKILYIQGVPGSGKDVFARCFASERFPGAPIYCAAAGRYPFDGYAGQPVVIVSDLDTDKLNGRDFLRTFDPHGMGDIDGRLYNRNLSNCKVVIFTHELEFLEFVRRVSSGMDARQFVRRFSTVWCIDGDLFDIFEHVNDVYSFSFVRRCLLPDDVKKVRDSGSEYVPASIFNPSSFVEYVPPALPFSDVPQYLPEDDLDLFDDNSPDCPF